MKARAQAGRRFRVLLPVLLAGVAAAAAADAPAELPPPVPAAVLPCTVCHGAALQGNRALAAPRLAGLPRWYLQRQLAAFRQGLRGGDPDDSAGNAMRAQALALDDESAAVAVAYAASLPPPAAGGPDSHPTVTEDSTMHTGKQVAGTAAAVALTLGLAQPATAEVRRHPLPGSDFPIAQAVEVIRGTTLVYHSGMVPAPADPDAERYSPAYWGDTEAQTLSVFQRLEASLAAKGLTFGDVVKMQIFLVAPEPGGAMDFAGMMRAYRQYFGTDAQPRLPARSAFQVAGLAAPGMLVEIEVTLARP